MKKITLLLLTTFLGLFLSTSHANQEKEEFCLGLASFSIDAQIYRQMGLSFGEALFLYGYDYVSLVEEAYQYPVAETDEGKKWMVKDFISKVYRVCYMSYEHMKKEKDNGQ